MKINNPEKESGLKNYAKYSSIGIQMLAIILIGVYGGVKLDELIFWEFPIFTIILSILSVFLAIYYVVRDLLKKDNS